MTRRRKRRRKAAPTAPPVWLVDETQAPELARLLAADDRKIPVVVTSCRDGSTYPVDPDALAAQLGDVAQVVKLADARAAWALTRALPPGSPDVFGGATRIYRPRLADDYHPTVLCFPGDDVERATQQVLDHARAHPPTLEQLASRRLPGPPVADYPAPADDNVSLSEDVTQLVDGNNQLRDQLRQTKAALREAQDRITNLESTLAELHQDRSRPVYADPEQQLRHEIHLHWLHTEQEEHRKPLRPYAIGPDFLASLEADLIDRERVVTVCVEVLTRLVHDIPARETHQLRESAAGGTPARQRADGATAWRAALRRYTPGAPRLMWWELPDGSVELGRAAHHDDTRLR